MRAVVALLMLPLLAVPAPVIAEDAGFMLCEALPHITCVWSGNSFYLRGELIRLADIDAPERYTSACPAASNLSWLSARRLRDLLNAASFEIQPAGDGASTSGGIPSLVTRDGESLGNALVAAGLARPASSTAQDWCAKSAQ